MDREHNASAWAVWHTAYLPMFKRAARLEDMLVGRRRAQPVKSWQEQLAAWEAFVARG